MSTAHIDLTDLDGAVTGSATVEYSGQGDDSAVVSAAVCEGLDREGVATFRAAGCGDVSRRVVQEGLREAFTDWDFLVADGGTFHVLKPAGTYEFVGSEYTVAPSVVIVDGEEVSVPANTTVRGTFKTDITEIVANYLASIKVTGDISLPKVSSQDFLTYVELHFTGKMARSFTSMFYGGTWFKEIIITGAVATNVNSMFSGCSALTTLALSGWDTSKVTALNGMFDSCSALTTLDVSGWDTSAVTALNGTFYKCSSLTTLDVSGWDTSKVTAMQETFALCSSLTTLRLGSWDLSKCTTYGMPFAGCSSLAEVSGTITGIGASLDLSSCPLTRESALVFINGLAAGVSGTLSLSSTTKALLTDADIQIATDKGWTIA